MKTTCKLVRNMTDEEVRSCKVLGLKVVGRIVDDLKFHLKRPRSGARVVMIKDDQKVLSWGLIDYTDGKYPVVQVYTRATHRRRGLGTRVIQKVKRVLGSDCFVYFGHDDRSAAFFSQQDIRYPNSEGQT